MKRELLFFKFMKDQQVVNERVMKERGELVARVAQLEHNREVDSAPIESQRIWIEVCRIG